MNMNSIADAVLDYLNAKHNRCYRNRAPKDAEFIYIVYRIDSGIDTFPSEDLYLNIDIYEDANKLARDIEGLADLVDNGLNHTIINNENLSIQFEREQRQYVPPEELISTHLVNLRYVMRVYFK